MQFSQEMIEKFGKDYKDKDIICCEYEPGNTFYFVHSGKVKITKIIDDKEKTLDYLNPGEIFGEMSILEGMPRSATVVAVGNVRVLEFSRANFEILIQGNPQLAFTLLKIFSKRIYDQKRRFMILTLTEPDVKVADVFVMLAENKNIDLSESTEVSFETNAEEVANWCGMKVDNCREILNNYARQKKITIFDNKIVVKNINELSRLVNSRRRSE